MISDTRKVCRLVAEVQQITTLTATATWDSPPRPGEPGYPAFETALSAFLQSRDVFVVKSRKDIEKLEKRAPEGYGRYAIDSQTDQQPDLGQSNQLKLMKFQVRDLPSLFYSHAKSFVRLMGLIGFVIIGGISSHVY